MHNKLNLPLLPLLPDPIHPVNRHCKSIDSDVFKGTTHLHNNSSVTDRVAHLSAKQLTSRCSWRFCFHLSTAGIVQVTEVCRRNTGGEL